VQRCASADRDIVHEPGTVYLPVASL